MEFKPLAKPIVVVVAGTLAVEAVHPHLPLCPPSYVCDRETPGAQPHAPHHESETPIRFSDSALSAPSSTSGNTVIAIPAGAVEFVGHKLED